MQIDSEKDRKGRLAGSESVKARPIHNKYVFVERRRRAHLQN